MTLPDFLAERVAADPKLRKAKAKMLKDHDPFMHLTCGDWRAGLDSPYCPALRLLGFLYHEHPGWRSEWMP